MSLDKSWVIEIICKLLSSSEISYKLSVDKKKFIEFEFCFGPKSKKFEHLNYIQVYPKKGKIFWKMTVMTKEPTQSLENLKHDQKDTYSFDWIADGKNLSVGGFRRSIYTDGDKEYAEEFLRNSLKEFREIYEILNQLWDGLA